jgi:hypothetical protein
MFVYQRNMERISEGLLKLEDDLVAIIEQELAAAYPAVAKQAGVESKPDAGPG